MTYFLLDQTHPHPSALYNDGYVLPTYSFTYIRLWCVRLLIPLTLLLTLVTLVLSPWKCDYQAK